MSNLIEDNGRSQTANFSKQQFKQGDPEVFETLYKKLYQPIYRYISNSLTNRCHAEEVTQEVFFKAFRFRDSFDSGFEISTWLWTIAKNTVCDELRRIRSSGAEEHGLEEEAIDIEKIPSKHSSPEEKLIQAAHHQKLHEIMNELPDIHKKVLVLRLVHHLPYKKIAAQLKLSLSAVKCLAHRAKEAMTTIFDSSQQAVCPGRAEWRMLCE